MNDKLQIIKNNNIKINNNLIRSIIDNKIVDILNLANNLILDIINLLINNILVKNNNL